MDAHRTFQVDLAGLVDLLSHHLYASPRVYVRELLQNAVDAITARRLREPGAPGLVTIETTGDGLRVTDSGVGLTEAQVHELLATIGRSSKRDDLGFARHEFLGQFGIGLLSCFLVAREIVVVTTAAGAPTVRWTGYDDGRYLVEAVDGDHPVGTTVTLVPRPGAQGWFAPATVLELARLYGDQLPIEVTVDGTPTTGPVVSAPWDAAGVRAWTAYAERTMGLTPFDVIPLSVPEAGLTGAAFVMPQPLNPAQRGGHRVYLKRMLLAESAEGLLPDWAFFARCVVDTSELRPTASREALYEDGLLDSTREALGDQLRGWLVRLARTDPRRLGEFLRVHHLGVKALALYDDAMLQLVAAWWPMETNVGRMTLGEFRERHGVIRYSATTDQFRQLAGVAAAQDLALINAGYTYDTEIIERLAQVERGLRTERLDPTDLATRFETLDPGVELGLRGFSLAAQRALDRLGCEVVLRAFDPPTVPALFLVDRETAFRQELRATRDKADPVWSDVLSALDDRRADTRPELVLNHRNPLVRRITVLPTADLVELAVEALYGQALLLGYHPIRPADAALLNRSFLGLLDRAVPPTDPEARA
ncbi:HSP90 family protein [Asanoa sp. NPDC049573]|uniref:HSP90 family protein n=1 Tax=Asanoa sp. NPDC049573 TaxID=3155396 RepID=UPI00341A4B3B